MAVIKALLGYTSEAHFIRYAHTHLRPWFPFLPNRAGYNKRLRGSGQLLQHLIAYLTRQCPSYHHDLWLVDSTRSMRPIPPTALQSELAGWARYG